jgi:hypothetical protein
MFKQSNIVVRTISKNSKKIKINFNNYPKRYLTNKLKTTPVNKTTASNTQSFENLMKFINTNSEDKIKQILDLYSKAVSIDQGEKAAIDNFLNLKDYVIFLKTDHTNPLIKDLLYSSYESLNKSMTYIISKGQFYDYLNNIINRLLTALNYKDSEEAEKMLTYIELDIDCINTYDLTMLDYEKIEECNLKLIELLEHKTNFNKIKLKKAIVFYSHILKEFSNVRENINEVIDYDDNIYKNYEEMKFIKKCYNLVLKAQSHLEVDTSITINSLNEAIVIDQKIKTLGNMKLKDILIIYKGELYRGIYYAYIAEGDIETALKLSTQLEEIYKEEKDDYNLCMSYFFAAGLYINRNDYNNAIRYSHKFYEYLDTIPYIKNAIGDETNFERKLMLYKDILDYEQKVAVCETLFYIYESSIEEDLKTLPYLEEYSLAELGILMFKAFDLFFTEFNMNLFFLYFKIFNVNYQMDNKKICIEMGEEILAFLESENEYFDENQLKHFLIETYYALIVCYSDVEPNKSNQYIESLYENFTNQEIGPEKEKNINHVKENNINRLI